MSAPNMTAPIVSLNTLPTVSLVSVLQSNLTVQAKAYAIQALGKLVLFP